jgi:hypothetical protein
MVVDNNSELYDFSTFTSMIENVSNVVNNIDFEFKKIALMFPRHINNNRENIIFFKEKNKNTKYSKWIDEIKEEHNNEMDINVIELSSKDIDSKYNLSKASLFHLLQKPSTEISKQIVLQENKASSFQEIFSSWPWPAQSLIKKEKAKLFHLLQIYNSSETSRQIAIQSHHESYQSADLSMMVSLNEFAQSAQISPAKLDKIKEDIYCLDSDSWFQVDQKGKIFLTNQMLLEALQQISKSRDDKFFSERLGYIAKDFDSIQSSQYSIQSSKEYEDWLAGSNQDKIL